jgi:hypothetical protein
MKMKLKSIVTAGALTLATLVSTQASAVIMSIDFSTQSGWLADGMNSGTRVNSTNTNLDCAAGASHAENGCGLAFTGAVGAIAGAYTSVNWGSTSSKSGLDILSKSGTLVTNGDWVQTGLVTHRNQTIPTGSASLASLELATLFAVVNPALFVIPAKVGITFKETPNVSDPSKCPTPQVSAVGCDDTFSVNLQLPAIKFKDLEGQWYKISFKLNPLSGVTSITNPDGSISLVTAEASNNQIEFMARLDTLGISEPATVGILGLSLMMLSLRRNKKAAV